MSELRVDERIYRDTYPEEFARPGIDAFANSDRRAQLSRSTQILVLAEQLTRAQESESSDFGSAPTSSTASIYANEVSLLDIPVVASLNSFDSTASHRSNEFRRADRPALWRMAKEGDSIAAAQLIRDSIRDTSPIVQAAASIGTIVLESASADKDSLLSRSEMQLLRGFSSGPDTETKRLASAFVDNSGAPELDTSEDAESSHVDPPLPRYAGLEGLHDPPVEILSSAVHGTYSHYSRGPMAPGSAFYNHLRADIARDLFPCFAHHFRWEGRYDVRAQRGGAEELHRWTHDHARTGNLNVVFAHSHGGNVALNAAASGLHIRRLVLLSTPAQHRPMDEWSEIHRNVDRIISYRTHLDKVILADQLASRLPWNRERRAPSDGLEFPADCGVIQPQPIGWLKHSKWLREDVWKSRGITDSVRGYVD